MSLFNNNAITNLINESEKRTADIERSMKNSDYELSMRRAEEIRKDIKELGGNAETEKYKKLYQSMLSQRNEFTNKPLSHLAQKYPNLYKGASQLEQDLTYWILNNKGAREVAIEYGLASNKSISEVDEAIKNRTVKAIENSLPLEHGNNISQSKSDYLNPNSCEAIVPLNLRIESVKRALNKNKI